MQPERASQNLQKQYFKDNLVHWKFCLFKREWASIESYYCGSIESPLSAPRPTLWRSKCNSWWQCFTNMFSSHFVPNFKTYFSVTFSLTQNLFLCEIFFDSLSASCCSQVPPVWNWQHLTVSSFVMKLMLSNYAMNSVSFTCQCFTWIFYFLWGRVFAGPSIPPGRTFWLTQRDSHKYLKKPTLRSYFLASRAFGCGGRSPGHLGWYFSIVDQQSTIRQIDINF